MCARKLGDGSWLHTECDEEIAKHRQEAHRLLNAACELRDFVLFERGPLAEAGLNSDQINAVLGVIDDAFSGLWPTRSE